jgi:hypothetical protein
VEGEADPEPVRTNADVAVEEVIALLFIPDGGFAATGHKRSFNVFLRYPASSY